MTKILKILIFYIFTTYVLTALIIPDPQNPIMINMPFNKGIQEITVRFQLPQNSGLLQYQYIGLNFPGCDSLRLESKLPIKYNCSLTDSQGNQYSVYAESNDKTTAYCQLTDTRALVSQNTYTMTITFNSDIVFARNNLNIISLFTCTSNDSSNYILIDSNPIFADAAFYPNFFVDNTIQQMINQGIFQTDKVPTINESFNFQAQFQAYQRISASMHTIVLKFPLGLNVNSNVQYNLLNSNGLYQLSLIYLNNEDGMNSYILNINFDIMENTSFILNFVIQSTDVTMSNGNFVIDVFYKNSYSLLSESISPYFTVTPANIQLFTAANPDGWDIYENAAWPFMFTIISPINIHDGGYFVIQQENTLLKRSKLNFIASTCDFSNSDSISQEFGQRPVCFPLRNDMNYPNQSNSAIFKGSAIVFKIPSVVANQTISLKVFGYAQTCGSSNYLNNPMRSTQFTFSLRIYKSIDMTKLNEARLSDADIIAATPSPIVFNNVCYSSISSPNPFADSDYSSGASSRLMFNEFANFDYGVTTEKTTAKCSDCLISNLAINSNFVSGYVNNPSNLLTYESYFTIKSDFLINSGLNPRNMIALPYNNNSNVWSYLPGSVIAYFSQNYLTQTNNNCFMSWGFNSNNLNSQNVMLNTANSQINPSTGGLKNIVAQQIVSGLGYAMDMTNTNLNGSSYFQISSVYDDGTNIKFITDYAYSSIQNTISPSTFAFYTDCLKYDKTSSNITKSIYNYIDFMIGYNNSPTNKSAGNNIRINRFFKFASSLGFFDSTKVNRSSNIINFHMVSFGYSGVTLPNLPSLDTPSICLIQLNADSLNNSNTYNSNLLAIYINNLKILDVDYTDTASTYPISADQTNEAYAFPSTPFTMGIIDTGTLGSTISLGSYSNSVQNLNSYSASVYYQYLGNLLLIQSGANKKFKNDLIIPTHCPLVNSDPVNGPFYIPTITIQWVNSNSNNFLISSFNTQFMDNSGYSYFSPSTALQSKQYTQISPIYTTLRFSQYSVRDNYQLYLIPYATTVNGIPVPPTTNYNCSGYSLFLNSVINFDDSVASFGLGVNSTGYKAFVYSSPNTFQKTFYWRGKPFTKAIYSATSTNQMEYNPSDPTKINYFSGIKRPNLADLAVTFKDNQIAFPTTDLAAFYCTSSGLDPVLDANYFTNYNTNLYDVTGSINFFLLDWNPDSTTQWPKAIMSSDKVTESIYSNDLAGNFKMTMSFPQNLSVPKGMVIRINSSYFLSSASLCGIIDNMGNTSDCQSTIDQSNSIDCTVPSLTNIISVCCYNINTSNLDLLLPSVSVYPPPDPNIFGVNNQIFNSIFNLPVNGNTWNNENSNQVDLVGGGAGKKSSPQITSIQYLNYFQQGAYTKALLTISLPREVVRNMKISIFGDLTKNFIPLIKPKCSASFGADPTKGDVLLESCVVQTPNVGENFIITTRNSLYKCGASFSTTLYVYVWPVRVFGYSQSTPFSFYLPMTVNNNNIANPVGKSTLTYSGTSINNSAPVNQPRTFCQLNTVDPPVLGELADYTFSFDLTRNYAVLSGTRVDEMVIFFPFSSFPQNISGNNSLKCYFRSIQVMCSTIADNLLLIQLIGFLDGSAQSFVIGQDPSLLTPSVTVSGIVNNVLKNSYFLCSLNNVNRSGNKSQIINGTGPILININDAIQPGMIKLLDISTSNNTPRITSDLIIDFVYDTSLMDNVSQVFDIRNLNIPTGWKTLTNANFIITLPDDYELSLYSITEKSNIQATISEFYYDALSILRNYSYLTQIHSISSNRIYISVNQTINLNVYYQYWEVHITGIKNPTNELGSTGRFKITLFSSSGDYLFKSYANFNYVANTPLSTTVDDQGLIRFGKGVAYSFSNNLNIIDIVSSSQSTSPLIVKPGRYTKFTFRLRSNGSEIIPRFSSTNISMVSNPLFGTDNASYHFISAIGQIDFYLGTPCTTASNIYKLNFSIDNTVDFASIETLLIYVDQSVGSIIGPGSIRDVITGGVQDIKLTLSEPTYSQFIITYSQASDTRLNDPTARIYPFIFNPMDTTQTSQFYISDLSASGLQYFQVSNPNSCYNVDYSTLTYNVNAENNDIPTGYDLGNYISYVNSETDNTLPKNSIKVLFSPILAPLYLTCYLTYNGQNFPYSNIVNNISPSNSFYLQCPVTTAKEYIPVSIGTYPLIFNNLIRGGQYQLSCVVQTTLKLNSKLSSVSLSQIAMNTIKTEDLYPTNCVEFGFKIDPGTNVRNAILEHCQTQFFGQTGCMTCVDNQGKTVKGVSFSNLPSCPNNLLSNNRLLGSNSAYNFSVGYTSIPSDYQFQNNLGSTQSTYRVCAVQDFNCATDTEFPRSSAKIMTDMITSLRNQAGFDKNLGIANVKVNTVKLITDLDAPEISLISQYITNTTFSMNGNFSISFNSVPFDLVCYWMINESFNYPEAQDIVYCGDQIRCGSFRLYGTVAMKPTIIEPFETSSYNVWFTCLNNLPHAQQVSSVILLYQFDIAFS